MLSPQDERLSEGHYVPVVSSDLRAQGYYDPSVSDIRRQYNYTPKCPPMMNDDLKMISGKLNVSESLCP